MSPSQRWQYKTMFVFADAERVQEQLNPFASESRCLKEQEGMFDQVLQEQGYGPLEESLARFQQEPEQHTPLSAWPFTPEYLDLIEEWLRGLRP